MVDYDRYYKAPKALARYHHRLLWAASFIVFLILLRQLLIRRAHTRDLSNLKEVSHDTPQKEISKISRLILGQLEEMERRQEDKRGFVATLSHDLKSPLASMKGYVEALRKKRMSMDDEAIQRYLDVLTRNTNHVTSLVTQLLQVDSVEQEIPAYVRAPFVIEDCFRQISFRYQPLAQTKGISLSYSPSTRETLVNGNEELLVRALSNILDNAIKYCRLGGMVSMSCIHRQEEVVLSIQDEGPGIEEEELNEIFKRFYRGKRLKNSKNGSAGLGLFVSRKVIDAHGGRIEVSSVPGEGTTFVVYLPICTSGR